MLAGCGGEDEAARGPWVVGRWQATTAEGSSEITFEREGEGEGVVLVSEGTRVPTRATGPERYEGEVAQDGVKVRFAFERRGERLLGRYTLVTGGGEQALPDQDYARAPAPTGGPGSGASGAGAAREEGRGSAATGGAQAQRDGGRSGAQERAPWVVGRWRATTAEGTTELEVEREGEGVVLVSGGVRMPLRATGSERWGGEAREEGVTLRYAFERRGEQLVARYTLVTAAGEQAVPEVTYARVAAAAAGASTGEHPAAMLGHWRFTDVMNDFDLQTQTQTSVLTEINYLLEAGGVMRSWIRTEDGSSGKIPKATGRWRLRAGELEVDKGQGWSSLGRAVLDGARMMLVQGSQKRVYQRQ